MAVRRISANLQVMDTPAAVPFYGDLLGLEVVMDHGWIRTFAAPGSAPIQVSVAVEGGGGTPVPALSIEVDDVDQVYAEAIARGFEIVHPITDEPWGVRRFFVRDPFGTIVNILMHSPSD